MLDYLTLRPQAGVSPLSASLDAFLLSREAMRCTPKTLEHYAYTVGGFVRFLREQPVGDAHDITAHHIRAYPVSLQRRGLKDATQRVPVLVERQRGWGIRERGVERHYLVSTRSHHSSLSLLALIVGTTLPMTYRGLG